MLPAVKTGGGVATVRWYQGDGSRDLKVHAVSVADMAEEQDKLDELRQLAEDGAVTLRVADSYAPEDAWRAHERLEAGGTRGRLVIDFTRGWWGRSVGPSRAGFGRGPASVVPFSRRPLTGSANSSDR